MADPSPTPPETAPPPRLKVFADPIKACPRWDLAPLYIPMGSSFVASFNTNRPDVLYRVTVSGGGTATPPTLTPGTDGNQVTVTLPASGIYYLQVAPDDMTANPGFPHVVEVLYNPMGGLPLTVSLTGSPSPGLYAPGALVTLTANAAGGTPPYNYSWSWDGSAISSTSSTIYVRLTEANKSYNFTVQVTDQTGGMPVMAIAGYFTTP